MSLRARRELRRLAAECESLHQKSRILGAYADMDPLLLEESEAAIKERLRVVGARMDELAKELTDD